METRTGQVTTLTQEDISSAIESHVLLKGDHHPNEQTTVTFTAEISNGQVQSIAAEMSTVTMVGSPLPAQPDRTPRVDSNAGN